MSHKWSREQTPFCFLSDPYLISTRFQLLAKELTMILGENLESASLTQWRWRFFAVSLSETT